MKLFDEDLSYLLMFLRVGVRRRRNSIFIEVCIIVLYKFVYRCKSTYKHNLYTIEHFYTRFIYYFIRKIIVAQLIDWAELSHCWWKFDFSSCNPLSSAPLSCYSLSLSRPLFSPLSSFVLPPILSPDDDFGSIILLIIIVTSGMSC